MKDPLKLLIVDDQPLIINCYKIALQQISDKKPNCKFDIRCAVNCDEANYYIENSLKGILFDLVLLDINIPPSEDMKLLSGEDVGLKLKKLSKVSKLIVITSHNNNHLLCNIFKNLNPDGFLVKSDFDFKELITCINSVLNDIPYYSKTITRLIRNHMSNQILLDKTDREILFHISRGAKTKDLPGFVNLSIAGIEKRKRQLREVFNTKRKDDISLIERAKEKGFV